METKNDSLSYGPYLRALRLKQDMQLKTVARKTNISKEYLIALESENRDELPDEVFIKGFIRSYADAIDADADEAVRRYPLKCCAETQPLESKKPHTLYGTKSWLRLTTLVSLLVGAIAFSVYGMNLSEPVSESHRSWHHKLIKLVSFGSYKHVSQVENSDDADKHTTDILLSQPVNSDNHYKKEVLKIIVKKKTWLRLMTDTIAPKHYKLNGGDRLEFEVVPYMKLAIGCADNVQLLLNDKILNISDKASHNLTFKVPL